MFCLLYEYIITLSIDFYKFVLLFILKLKKEQDFALFLLSLIKKFFMLIFLGHLV